MTLNPIDYLKFVAAEAGAIVEQVQGQLGELDLSRPVKPETVDAALSQLDAVRTVLVESAAAFCVDGRDMLTYSDGRPIHTRLDLETGNYLPYIWHPDHGHRLNQPQDIGVVTTTGGKRKRLMVTAPGVLGAVDVVRVVE